MSLEELQQLKASFDLRWNADMRARKLWQEAHPGNDLVWPDHADLCVWLMEQERFPVINVSFQSLKNNS